MMIKKVEPFTSLKGTLEPPPDKSISHRAAMFASLHEGTSTVENYSPAADPHSTLHCLEELGVTVTHRDSAIEVEGVGRSGFSAPERDLDCGNSGTTMRLLAGLLAGAGINCRLTGDESLSSRTMRRIIGPLENMGAKISAREGDYAPLEIEPASKLKPIEFRLPIPSAQLKSCILLAGLHCEEPVTVIESVQSRDHTERLLNLEIEKRSGLNHIRSSSSTAVPEQSFRVPGDFSAAAFWLAAGAVHNNSDVLLKHTGINPSRTAFLDILQEMGAELTIESEQREGPEPVGDIHVSSSSLKPVYIPGDLVPNCIDELPILAVTMLFADGISRISGASELRHKETDRLHAVAELLRAAGAEFIEFKDGLEIHGDPDFTPQPAEYKSFGDHRIAMSAAVLALMASDTSRVTRAECTDISYPGFWDDMELLTN